MRLDCEIVQELYSLYAENELSHKVRNQVGEHLNSCETCRQIYEKEVGFHDIVQLDSEIIQPDRSIEERLKKRLKRQKYYQYVKTGLILVLSIVLIYFLFFRFTFLIGSTDLSTPSFEQDYKKIQEKLNISEDAKITSLTLRFNSSGQMEDFRTRIVDFSETYLDLYDMAFSPRIDGFHMYKVDHARINNPDFISESQAQLSAQKIFTVLNYVDFDSILAETGANRYMLATDAQLKDIQVRHDVLPREQYFIIDNNSVGKLAEGQILSGVYGLYVHNDTVYEGSVRAYFFYQD